MITLRMHTENVQIYDINVAATKKRLNAPMLDTDHPVQLQYLVYMTVLYSTITPSDIHVSFVSCI